MVNSKLCVAIISIGVLLSTCNNKTVPVTNKDDIVDALSCQLQGVVDWQYGVFTERYYPHGFDSILPIEIDFFVNDHGHSKDTFFAVTLLSKDTIPQNGYRGSLSDTNYYVYVFDRANVGKKYYSADLLSKETKPSPRIIKDTTIYLFGSEFAIRNDSIKVLFH